MMNKNKICEKKKLCRICFLFFALFILQTNFSYAQVQKDVSVSIIVPEETNASNYTKFIRITNKDDIEGVNDALLLYVLLNLSEYGGDISSWNASKTINSYSESGMGVLSLEENKKYFFCVEIVPINFTDYVLENNFVCRNISTKKETQTNLSNVSSNLSSDNLSYNLSYNFSDNLSNNNSYNLSDNSDYNLSNNYSNNLSNNTSQTNFSDGLFNLNNSEYNASLYVNDSELNMSEEFFNESMLQNESTIQNNSTIINESINVNASTSINESATNMSFQYCDCKLQIMTEKELYYLGEKLEFKIIDCWNYSKYSYPVEYWIDDRNGIAKQKVNTTTKSVKSFTPNFDEEEKYFIINAKLEGCTNSSSSLVVFTITEEKDEKAQFLKIISEDSFYAKKESEIIYVKIEGYKKDSSKTLISVWLEYEGKKYSSLTKIYVPEKNSEFNLEVPLLIYPRKSGEYKIIAEGIDEKAEEKIKIIIEEQEEEKTSENDENEEDKNEFFSEKESKSSSKITSFYTRKKIFEENITVYLSISDSEGKTLELRSNSSFIKIENISDKISADISINSQNEKIYAFLLDGEEVIDSSELILNLSKNSKDSANSKKEENESEKEKNKIYDFYFQQLNESSNVFTENASIIENSVNKNKITGEVVFSKSTGKNIFFIFLSTGICYLIFRKKIISFFAEKTKIFK